MPTHAESRIVPYTPDQMRGLVLDIEQYPDFLPWVVDINVLSVDGDHSTVEVHVGFKMFREKYTCRVDASDPMAVTVSYLDGPMKYLNTWWRFTPVDPDKCKIDFRIEFEFKSFLLQKTIGIVFGEAVAMMVRSFDRRAAQLYNK